MTLLNTNGWVCKEMFSEITIGIFEEINNFSCKINFFKNAIVYVAQNLLTHLSIRQAFSVEATTHLQLQNHEAER